MAFETYRQKFVNGVQEIEAAVMEFPWENEMAYQMWVAQTFYMVRHTSHFICLAAGLVPVEDRDEHYHMIEHLKEEQHHDAFAVKDLAHFGKTWQQFPELPETALMWQNLYYWLSLRKPRSILGHSVCLEGMAGSVGSKLLPVLAKHYDRKAYTFLNLHFKADIGHFEEGLKLMATFPDTDLEDIAKVQEQSAALYISILNGIQKWVATQSKAKNVA